MSALLTEWGLEILFGLVSATVLGYAKYHGAQLKKQAEEYKKLAEENEAARIEATIDRKLEEVYQELEELRKYVRESENVKKTHMSLIIASYRFRLIQICKELIKQGYMTQSQYDQLTEFYKLYVGLGGNGQAKQYYEKAIQLPIRPDDEI